VSFDWFHWSDLFTILALVGLEGILSGDNALVLAVLVQRLPTDEEQRKALRYGIIGAFVLRAIATLLAVYLLKAGAIVALLGGLYLLYLPYKHFTTHPDEAEDGQQSGPPRKGFLGLSLFWTTVVSVELTDLVFAVDSILVAVAMTRKEWVIIIGGILGIIMMRMLTMQVLQLVRKYPRLIDGAYIIVAWVGIKLFWEFLHHMHWVPFAIPKVISIGLVIVLFVASYLYAKAHPAPEDKLSESAGEAQVLLTEMDEEGREPAAAQ
jgi:YkoY family integral membrane protein